jgi:hypothetical protein
MCQNQKDFNNEIINIRHDLMFKEYPKEFVDSVINTSTRNRPLQTQCTRALSSSLMLSLLPRNSDASGTVSIPEQFSRLNIHFVGH